MNGFGARALFILTALTLVYQGLQFWAEYDDAVQHNEDAFALTREEVCRDAEKKHRYQNRLDCSDAERGARRSPWAVAYQSWLQKRMLFNVITLNDRNVSIFIAVAVLYAIKLRMERPPAPPGAQVLQLPPATERALLGAPRRSRGGLRQRRIMAPPSLRRLSSSDYDDLDAVDAPS